MSSVTFTMGDGFTVISTLSRARQPAGSTPITTYSVVVAGVAIGLGMLLLDNPVEGDQVKNAPCSTYS